ncbi:hypothetical protein M5D96_013690 [Drosophila gunungcola]|uniref:Uncharacterized protein n=1 Tax=Drosophila gunungcola TaxID=103775 RepID=A0A9P9YBD0_9MUSC|nr:hypothetical protein M5D96_013690 [Drosophila gunungcola]
MDISVAHVSHAFGSFEADGLVWRQHTFTSTWPDGATEAEGTRDFDPTDASTDPNPTDPSGDSDRSAGARPANKGGGCPPAVDMLKKGPWVWPEPDAHLRPILRRQHSAPVAEARPAFMRQASTPDARRWKVVIQVEWPEGIGEAPAVVAARWRGGKRCVLV